MQNLSLFTKDLISPAEPPTSSSHRSKTLNPDLVTSNIGFATARAPQDDNSPLQSSYSPNSPHRKVRKGNGITGVGVAYVNPHLTGRLTLGQL